MRMAVPPIPYVSQAMGRVASAYLAAREARRKKPTQKQDQSFLQEHGDDLVMNPVTGNKVKVKSLQRSGDPRARAEYEKLLHQWQAGDKEPKSDEGVRVDVDMGEYKPSEDMMAFAGRPPDGAEPTAVNSVLQDMAQGDAPRRVDVEEAYRIVQRVLSEGGGDASPGDIEKLKALDEYLRAILGDDADAKGIARPDSRDLGEALDLSEAGQERVDRLMARYSKPAQKVVSDLGIKPIDVDQLERWKDKGGYKKDDKKSPQARLKAFLQFAEPETRERVKDMDPDDFEALLASLWEEAKGVKLRNPKSSSLRGQIIRLAYLRPNMRASLLGAMRGAP